MCRFEPETFDIKVTVKNHRTKTLFTLSSKGRERGEPNIYIYIKYFLKDYDTNFELKEEQTQPPPPAILHYWDVREWGAEMLERKALKCERVGLGMPKNKILIMFEICSFLNVIH